MDMNDILDEIKANLTGDPIKDGPYLRAMSEKYKDEEFSDKLNAVMADILAQTVEKDYKDSLNAFLRQENSKVDKQLESARKRFKNLNFNGGNKILGEIIKNNIFAWNDTDEVTYKCFGTPLEYILYKNLFEEDTREIKAVNCDLAKVYTMFCYGLMQKKRYADAKNAIEKAVQLNPVDPETRMQYIELAKRRKDLPLLREQSDMLLKTAVSKKQVGYAYFSYSFYFSEKGEYDKALAMLQMSRIFRESKLYKTELQFICEKMGVGDNPPKYDSNQLMALMNKEDIQPGPSAAVVGIANHVANELEKQNELKLSKYFYDIVYELTEDEKTGEHIKELEERIK